MSVEFNENLPLYQWFVSERHRVHERRALGLVSPWTDDPVLRSKKFCNMFRVLDYGSQFVARELLGPQEKLHQDDALMRAFLYRYTNRPDPWIHFREVMGRYPSARDLGGRLQSVWGQYRADGGKFFGGAYQMLVGKENAGMTRMDWVVGLAASVFYPKGDNVQVLYDFLAAWPGPQEERLQILKGIPRCNNFMGMQVLVDLGYWMDGGGDRENEFAAIGPGSKRGVARLTGSKDYDSVMRELQQVVHSQPDTPRLRLGRDRYGSHLYRKLSLTDIQNTLCEFDKYMRYSGGEVRDRTYRPAHPTTYTWNTSYVPTHWK